MKKTFKCICKDHLLKIEYSDTIEWINTKTKKKHRENVPELWIGIYEIHSPKTGRKYKKPKLISDFEVMGKPGDWGKEMDILMQFLDNITLAYALRGNK